MTVMGQSSLGVILTVGISSRRRRTLRRHLVMRCKKQGRASVTYDDTGKCPTDQKLLTDMTSRGTLDELG